MDTERIQQVLESLQIFQERQSILTSGRWTDEAHAQACQRIRDNIASLRTILQHETIQPNDEFNANGLLFSIWKDADIIMTYPHGNTELKDIRDGLNRIYSPERHTNCLPLAIGATIIGAGLFSLGFWTQMHPPASLKQKPAITQPAQPPSR